MEWQTQVLEWLVRAAVSPPPPSTIGGDGGWSRLPGFLGDLPGHGKSVPVASSRIGAVAVLDRMSLSLEDHHLWFQGCRLTEEDHLFTRA